MSRTIDRRSGIRLWYQCDWPTTLTNGAVWLGRSRRPKPNRRSEEAVALRHAAPVRTLLGALVEVTMLDAVPDILDLIDKIEGPIG